MVHFTDCIDRMDLVELSFGGIDKTSHEVVWHRLVDVRGCERSAFHLTQLMYGMQLE